MAERGRGRGRGHGNGGNAPIAVEELMQTQNEMMHVFMQHLQLQPPPPPPPPIHVRDKRGEFMKGRPPVFTHSADPTKADDWLCAVERQLNIAQCNDLEKVLYASGQLQGAAQTWWESYQATRPNNAPPITWLEFCRNFRARHINEGMMELKQEEFRSLRMGSMTVAEYHDTFEQLARYASNDVREDADK